MQTAAIKGLPRILTGTASREADARTISEFGLSGFSLMEVAGEKAADCILELYPNLSHAFVFAGTGNNGGDALVVARCLANAMISCTVVLNGEPGRMSEDTALNLNLLRKMMDIGRYSIQVVQADAFNWDEIKRADGSPKTGSMKHQPGSVGKATPHIPEQINDKTPDWSQDTVLIDGLLGTGIQSDVRQDVARLIDRVNASGHPVVSLDIPSGLNADTGERCGTCINATHTLAMGHIKLGSCVADGRVASGQLHEIRLSFPTHLLPERQIRLIEDNAMSRIPAITRNATHKYESGVVYVIGGSEGLSGAVVMSAGSAWKQGCGAVFAIVPRGLIGAIEGRHAQLIKLGIGNNDQKHFTEAHSEAVLEMVSKKPGVVLIGPGLGSEPEAAKFVRAFISRYNGPLVVDADALRHIDPERPFQGPAILTPHPGELKALTRETSKSAVQRMHQTETLAEKMSCIVVAKGNPTFVCKEMECWVTGYNTERFNRSGFGDILSGAIAGLWSVSEDDTFSCIYALWSGKTQYDEQVRSGKPIPGPQDLI